jgi:hypothetical protein
VLTFCRLALPGKTDIALLVVTVTVTATERKRKEPKLQNIVGNGFGAVYGFQSSFMINLN